MNAEDGRSSKVNEQDERSRNVNEEDKKDDASTDRSVPRWAEAMKEVAATGLAALFMTEDTVRSLLREKKLPKELIGQLLDGVAKKKDDLFKGITAEFGKVLSRIDLVKEVEKLLETHDVRVEAKIAFTKRGKTQEDEA
jgi:hypothetical protein